eukprot:6213320-Pleurochrysis_carterae.AAC.9
MQGPSLREQALRREVLIGALTRHDTLFGHAHMCTECIAPARPARVAQLGSACCLHRAATGWYWVATPRRGTCVFHPRPPPSQPDPPPLLLPVTPWDGKWVRE